MAIGLFSDPGNSAGGSNAGRRRVRPDRMLPNLLNSSYSMLRACGPAACLA